MWKRKYPIPNNQRCEAFAKIKIPESINKNK